MKKRSLGGVFTGRFGEWGLVKGIRVCGFKSKVVVFRGFGEREIKEI